MEIDQLTDEQIANLTPEQVEMLENDPDKLTEILKTQEKEPASEDQTDDDKPKPAVKESVANDAGEDEDPVVLNKSGKGVIPYEKHKSLRVEVSTLKERLTAAETAKTEATEKLNDLLAKRDEATTNKEISEADKAIDEYMGEIEADMPGLYKAWTANNAKNQAAFQEVRQENKSLRERLEKLERTQQETQQSAEERLREKTAEAKENNPDLVHWDAHDQDAFDEAVRQDDILRNTSKWATKPIAERFEEVVRRVRAIMPEASVPKKTPDPEKRKAEAKAKANAAAEREPTTLSDIQGAGNPSSEQELVENLPGPELVAKLLKMPAHKASLMRADIPD